MIATAGIMFLALQPGGPAPTLAPGVPLAAEPTELGRRALAFNTTSGTLSRALALSQSVPSLLDHPALGPLQPGLLSLPPLSPTAATESSASHKLEAPAKPAATPPASMQRTAYTSPLSAQLRRLTAVPPLPAAAVPAAPAAQAPSSAAELISALSTPRAAPVRSPPPPPPTLPPTLARLIPTLPKLAAPAPLLARQPAMDAPTLDQAVAAAAGTVAAATAAAGLAQTPKPLQVIPSARGPSHAPRPAISLGGPQPAQAFRAAAPAQVPGPAKRKPASPASTAPAPSPAGLAQTPKALRVIPPAQGPSHAPRPAISLRVPLHAQAPAAAAQAPGPAKRKLASPASTAPGPSPAELAQIRKKEAAENMKAASTMVNQIEAAGYATVPQVALSTTPAPPLPEQPPVPVNVTSIEPKSAVSMQLRISGAGVTPFDPQKQQQLINVFMDATAGNLSAPQFTVLLVSSAFSSRHRSLLQAPIVAMGSSKGTPLKDVVDVTMEVSAGTPGYAAAVRDQLAALINGKSYLDMALQRAGLNTWSIKLLTISIVQPSQSGSMLPCQKTFGRRRCLDKSGLTVPVVILIIAFGGALVVFSIILIVVLREVKENSGRTAGLEYPKNDSITMKTHVLKYVIGDHAHPSPSKE
ncbi:g11455 [Coccomyxa viridis]|uniref:G11455 protein n=1 Tax=Coccomyxa viridis TaxID=1274662 RepID=A0ABP1GF09_9CHLO